MKRYKLKTIGKGKQNERFSLTIFENVRKARWHTIYFNYFEIGMDETSMDEGMRFYFDDKHIATLKYLPKYIYEELEKIKDRKMRRT